MTKLTVDFLLSDMELEMLTYDFLMEVVSIATESGSQEEKTLIVLVKPLVEALEKYRCPNRKEHRKRS